MSSATEDKMEVETKTTEDPAAFKSIVEGSITMKYPANEEETVFYNPVQVQNRDLSILMLTLYSERLAVRKAVSKKKRELRQANHEATNRKSAKEIQDELDQYQASLDPRQVATDAGKQDGLTILDALAASGLRSMRYWKEIPGVKNVTINDLEPAAVERAHVNLKENKLQEFVVEQYDTHSTVDQTKNTTIPWQRPYGIHVQNGDAKIEMYQSQRPQSLVSIPNNNALILQQAKLQPQYDVIDLDPYGSASPFLDAAVQAIESGGMLCVTCTDMAALGGSHPETCYGRYASMPIPSARYLQEVALRILLYNLATTAAKYGRTIKPILSVGMNFYIRVFLEVNNDKAGVAKLSLQVGNVFQSTQCPSFHMVTHGRLGGKKGNVYQPQRAPPVPQCEETGSEFKVGGPMWLGPLHDPEVVQTALERLREEQSSSEQQQTFPNLKWIATRERLEGLLMSVKEELLDVPLFYAMPDFCKTLKCSAPPITSVKAALINGGYRVSGYHKDPQAIKTNAPNRFLWDIMRVWCKQHPPQQKSNNSKKEQKQKQKQQQGEAEAPEPKESAATKILAVEPKYEIDFSIPELLRKQIDANNNPETGKKKVSRFPMNPEAHWGPKKAASGKKRKIDDATTSNSTTEATTAS